MSKQGGRDEAGALRGGQEGGLVEAMEEKVGEESWVGEGGGEEEDEVEEPQRFMDVEEGVCVDEAVSYRSSTCL